MSEQSSSDFPLVISRGETPEQSRDRCRKSAALLKEQQDKARDDEESQEPDPASCEDDDGWPNEPIPSFEECDWLELNQWPLPGWESDKYPADRSAEAIRQWVDFTANVVRLQPDQGTKDRLRKRFRVDAELLRDNLQFLLQKASARNEKKQLQAALTMVKSVLETLSAIKVARAGGINSEVRSTERKFESKANLENPSAEKDDANYIPASEASQFTAIPLSQLSRLAKTGVIKSRKPAKNRLEIDLTGLRQYVKERDK